MISFATAKVYVQHIIAKLKVSDRTQAAWLVRGRPPSPRGVGTPALTPLIPPKIRLLYVQDKLCDVWRGLRLRAQNSRGAERQRA